MTAGIAAVILAAGAGSRFEGPGHKLLTALDGTPVARWAVDAAVTAGIGPVIVVQGAVDLAGVLPAGVEVVTNPEWEAGMATSLQVGLAAADRTGADVAVVGLGDQPWVVADAWRAVAASSALVAHATYSGRRGHPVRLHRAVWDQLPRTGERGGRALFDHGEIQVEEVPCPGSSRDIDTAEDLA